MTYVDAMEMFFKVPYDVIYLIGEKKVREKFSSGKNLVNSEKLVTFPRLIFQICHFSPTNF